MNSRVPIIQLPPPRPNDLWSPNPHIVRLGRLWSVQSVCLSVRPSVCTSIYPFVCLSVQPVCTSSWYVCLSIRPPVDPSSPYVCSFCWLVDRSVYLVTLSNRLFINPSSALLSLPCLSIPCIHLSVHPSASWYICLSVHPVLHLSFQLVSLSVGPSIPVHLYICLSIQSICPFIPSIGRSICPFIQSLHLSIHPAACPCVHPFISLSIRPSIRPLFHLSVCLFHLSVCPSVQSLRPVHPLRPSNHLPF